MGFISQDFPTVLNLVHTPVCSFVLLGLQLGFDAAAGQQGDCSCSVVLGMVMDYILSFHFHLQRAYGNRKCECCLSVCNLYGPVWGSALRIE